MTGVAAAADDDGWLQFLEDDDERQSNGSEYEEQEEEEQMAAIAYELVEQARSEFASRMRKLAASGGGVRRRGNARATHPLDVPMRPSGTTPMAAAAAANDVEFMQALFDAGASLAANAADVANHPLLGAVSFGAGDAVAWLLEHGVPADEAGDTGDGTPLWCAIDRKDDDIAALLIERGASLDFSPDPHLNTLMFAVARGLPLTSRLIAERASYLIQDAMSRNSELLMSSCLEAAFLPLTRHILANFDVDLSVCSRGTTYHPLVLASNEGLHEHVDLLIEHGAPVNQASKRGTALHVAANGGYSGVVKRLLAAGAVVEPDVRWKGCTPLLLAARAGDLDSARLLVEAGADTGALGQRGEALLHFATNTGNADLVRFVLPFSKVDQTDHNGTTATLWACMSQSTEHDEVLDALLEAGAKVDTVDKDDWAPFTALAANGRFSAIKKLVERGNSVHFRTPGNTNLLYFAADFGHVEMVQWLLSQGVDHKIASTSGTAEIGETPLYVAAETGHVEVLRLLIDAGGDIHHKTQSGLTPLAIAARNGHGHIVRYLLRRGAKVTRLVLEESVSKPDQPGPVIVLNAFGYQFDQDLLAMTQRALPFFALWLAGVPVDERRLPSRCIFFARLCGAIRGTECPDGINCAVENDDEHDERFYHPGEEDRLAGTALRFFEDIEMLGLTLINDRATEICIALQSLALPALVTLAVVDSACALAHVLPMHVKWRLVTLIKHFEKK
jgi:ankyrin repeat protein